MQEAYDVAEKYSCDTSTKVGALIIHPDNYCISRGWNAFPRGVEVTEERLERPTKYLFTVHAEQNALLNALFMGVSVRDCYLFTTHYPCADCAKLIIQAGISHIFFAETIDKPMYDTHNAASSEMLSEAGVEVQKFTRV